MDDEIQKTEEEWKKMEHQQLASMNNVTFDTEFYSSDRFEGYEKSIAVNDDEDTFDTENEVAKKMASYTASKQFFKEVPRGGGEDDEPTGFNKPSKIIDREDDYRRIRLNRVIPPERNDPFLDKTPGLEVRTYADVMREEALKRQRQKEELMKEIAEKAADKKEEVEKPAQKRRNRWDQSEEEGGAKKAKPGSHWDLPDSILGIGRWDATPTPVRIPLYSIPEENRGQQFDVPKEMPGGLPFMKPEDYQYFGSLLNEEDEEELSPDEQKERKIMKLLLKVKNGTPPQRKTALRQLTDKAREFGAGPFFNRILPLLMQPTLEDQERHLLVKVIDRILYKLNELVRPYVHKILVLIEPL